MEIIFWLSIVLLMYPYFFYPLIALAIGAINPKPIRRQDWLPMVTVLIPAFNEEDCIGATVQNKLEQNYPAEKIQIIVVSDGSSDSTDEIVKTFQDRGVILLRREGREGKAAALNAAIDFANGEIVVFSDANSIFNKDTIRRLVENFADSDVGYVTGSLGFITDAASASGGGAGAYIRFENFLRIAETRCGSVIGVNGGVDAIRRRLYVDTPPNLITDFILPLTVMVGGHRVVYDSRAISQEVGNTQLSSEFRMRVRVALRAMQGLSYMRRLLNPIRFPIESFCIFSHKILRYMAFLFLIAALISNVLLAKFSDFYQSLLIVQVLVYAVAVLGLLRVLPAWLRRITVVPSYLLMSYAAFALASFKFLRGDVMAIWRPRAG